MWGPLGGGSQISRRNKACLGTALCPPWQRGPGNKVSEMEVPAKLSVTFFPGSGNATMTTIPTLRKKMEPKSGRAKVIV